MLPALTIASPCSPRSTWQQNWRRWPCSTPWPAVAELAGGLARVPHQLLGAVDRSRGAGPDGLVAAVEVEGDLRRTGNIVRLVRPHRSYCRPCPSRGKLWPKAMPSKEYAPVTPAVLKWAREAAGYSIDEVAARLKVTPQRVLAWESGAAPMSTGRVDLLAAMYKRPTAVFYMPAPPREKNDDPRDFRDAPLKLAPKLIYQIRRANERRDVALELLEQLNESAAELRFTCREDDPPQDAGDRLRKLLNIAAEEQRAWSKDRSGYSAFNAWKRATEANGALVFQASRRDMDGARGFSLHATPVPVVVLSSEDTPTGRSFTLMHELAHLGLREGGLCDLHDRGVEAFCNKVAAATLMPERELRELVKPLRSLRRNDIWPEAPLRKLATTFSVSEQALVLRLVEIGEATLAFYQSKLPEFQPRGRQGSESGFVPPHVLALAQNGGEFTRLVVDAYHSGAITEHRASTYLHISHESLPKVIEEMTQRAVRKAS